MGDPVGRKDLVIFGASGFTGERVVRQALLKQRQDAFLSVILAGRSTAKLREVVNRAKQITGVNEFTVDLLEADINNPESIRTMCLSAKVLINCVGPFRFFGEPIVKACVENSTHYVDICGEPQFLENMQVKYDELAKSRGVYIVGSCGFDSIPSELGLAFTKRQFPGDLSAVETFLSFQSGEAGVAVNYGTWESAVYGISTSKELGPIRKHLYKTRTPKPSHKMEQKKLFFSEEANGWSIPFPGADRSVARRTEYAEFVEQQKRPVQVNAYLNVGSLFNVVKIMFLGAIFGVMAQFEITRQLLLKYPKFFSVGVFTREGPTEEQIAGTSFQTKFIGHGYLNKKPTDEVHDDLPSQTIVTTVTGPEPGYAATSAFVFECAMTILQELDQPRSKIPRFGVLTPGYAFGETNLIERLAPYGIKFEVVSRP